MQANNLSNSGQEANLQNYDNCNERDGKYKSRKKKRQNVRSHKSEGNSHMKLYVDGLNYLNRFFTIRSTKGAKVIDFEKDVQKAKHKVRNFVKAAEVSNISLEVFIDKALATKETFLKWKKRREKEYKDGTEHRDGVPPCCGLLLGELFTANGIKVHYSTVDCDDTVASFAYHYGGNVLSNDSDFFRYTSTKSSYSSLCSGKQTYFEIFSDFKLQSGELILIPAQLRPNKKIASERIILSPPPETRTTANFLDRPMQWEVDKYPEIYGSLPSMYTCSNVSCLLRYFTNLHLTVRPLRQALYNRLGENLVRERISTWNFDEEKVDWVEEEVFPDGTLDYLLDNPQAAVKLIFGHQIRPKNVSELLWKNHLFAQQVVVASICAWATGKSILDKLTPIPDLGVKLHDKNAIPVTRGKRHAKNAAAQISQDFPKVMDAPACDVFCNSFAMYQSHEGKRQHAKKAQINSNTIACKICNIFVNSEDMLKSHMCDLSIVNKLGKKHKNMDRALPQQLLDQCTSAKCELCDVAFTSDSVVTSHYEGRNHDKKVQKWLDQFCEKKDQMTRVETFSDKNCNVCNVEISSAVMAKMHFSGRQHRNKLAASQSGDSPGGNLNCAVCDVQCSNAVVYQSHVVGKQHAKKLAAQGQQVTTHQINSNAIACAVCNIFVSSEDTLNSHKLGKAHRKKLEMIRQEQSSFSCDLCGITVSDKSCLEMHLQGAKHRAKVARTAQGDAGAGLEVTKGAPPQFRCSLCDVSCTDQSGFNLHLQDGGHKAKAGML